MRGAPHSGFASDIVRISVRMSAATVGRPRWRLFHVQRRRKPRRCHARIVSVFTMTTARHSRHTRDNDTHSNRSLASDAPAEDVTAREDVAGVAGRGSQVAAWPEIGPTSAESGATQWPQTTSVSSLPIRGRNINIRSENGVFGRDRTIWTRMCPRPSGSDALVALAPICEI
jgi:hypothetical protein